MKVCKLRLPRVWVAVCGWAILTLVGAGCHAGGTAAKSSQFSDISPVGDEQSPPSVPTPTGNSEPTPVAVVPVTTPLPSTTPPGSDYEKAQLLKVGDTLNIAYHDTPTLEPPFEGPIKEDGMVTLIFNKSFVAVGKTPGQLEREIHDAYVPNFFKYMTVTVTHKDLTRFYFVNGEVKMPGREPYTGPITLLRAIATAGDFTDFAKKTRVQVARPGLKKVIEVDCIKARSRPELDIEIFPEDKITVLRRMF